MSKTELKLDYQTLEGSKNGLPVIIVAAGSATRMKGINKQLTSICGIPVIARTLMAFERSNVIKNIILVVRDEDIFEMQQIAEKYMITKLSDIVCGSDCRQRSVLKGFSRLTDDDDAVLIHDGARPLILDRTISDVATALEHKDAVICGVKPKDTIKQVDSMGKVISTPSREQLFSVQTPQGVKKKLYLEAVCKAKDISIFTDDAAVMESAGYEVYTVLGDNTNIKITTPEDIITAECFLKERDECE